MKDDFFPVTYDGAAFPPMRPFQDRAHEMLREGYRHGHRCQVIMAPTGSGKTLTAMRIIHEGLLKGKRAVFVCDRTTLIDQTSAVADSLGLTHHGIIQADHWRRDESLPFQIASAQTLAKRQYWPDADIIVIDECHSRYKVWTEHAMNTKAAVIGLSATPFSKGLGKIFTNLINATTMHEMVESGVLVPMRVLSGVRPDMRGARTKASGEWADIEVEKRGQGIIGDVVTEWLKYARNKKTIVFGATIKHCEELCRQFNELGVLAMIFTANTGDAERLEILKEFRKKDSAIRVLISVEALAKGFDVPDVGCIVDCRPLRKSLSTAIQIWGRGLRCAPGKEEALLLDHSGNIQRFREDFERLFFKGLDRLDNGEALDRKIRPDNEEKKEARGCPQCGYKPFHRRCMSCGFEKEVRCEIEVRSGEMIELPVGTGVKGKLSAEDRYSIWKQVCSYVRANHRNPDTAKGRAYYLFKDITGNYPSHGWRYDETPDCEISAVVYNKIRRHVIAFQKAKKKAQQMQQEQQEQQEQSERLAA
jgi:superfamily II DNA or RNA helicase